MEKNMCARTVDVAHAYELWESDDGWRWYVLKKWQTPAKEAKNPYARWLCHVVSPQCPEGETGDVYVADILAHAYRVRETDTDSSESGRVSGWQGE